MSGIFPKPPGVYPPSPPMKSWIRLVRVVFVLKIIIILFGQIYFLNRLNPFSCIYTASIWFQNCTRLSSAAYRHIYCKITFQSSGNTQMQTTLPLKSQLQFLRSLFFLYTKQCRIVKEVKKRTQLLLSLVSFLQHILKPLLSVRSFHIKTNCSLSPQGSILGPIQTMLFNNFFKCYPNSSWCRFSPVRK